MRSLISKGKKAFVVSFEEKTSKLVEVGIIDRFCRQMGQLHFHLTFSCKKKHSSTIAPLVQQRAK